MKRQRSRDVRNSQWFNIYYAKQPYPSFSITGPLPLCGKDDHHFGRSGSVESVRGSYFGYWATACTGLNGQGRRNDKFLLRDVNIMNNILEVEF